MDTTTPQDLIELITNCNIMIGMNQGELDELEEKHIQTIANIEQIDILLSAVKDLHDRLDNINITCSSNAEHIATRDKQVKDITSNKDTVKKQHKSLDNRVASIEQVFVLRSNHNKRMRRYASKIQAVVRGIQARDDMNRRHQAATTFQAAVRQHLATIRVNRIRISHAMYQAENIRKVECSASISIQKWWKNILMQKRIAEDEYAAAVIIVSHVLLRVLFDSLYCLYTYLIIFLLYLSCQSTSNLLIVDTGTLFDIQLQLLLSSVSRMLVKAILHDASYDNCKKKRSYKMKTKRVR